MGTIRALQGRMAGWTFWMPLDSHDRALRGKETFGI